jgi:hypothetical protein
MGPGFKNVLLDSNGLWFAWLNKQKRNLNICNEPFKEICNYVYWQSKVAGISENIS